MLKVFILITTIVSFCLLIILLNLTTPITAGPFGILAIFISAYLLLIGLIAYFLHIMSRLVLHLSTSIIPRRPFEALSLRRSYYYSTVISAAPVMLIGLQSVGRVSFYELLLMFAFVVIGCLYVSRRVK